MSPETNSILFLKFQFLGGNVDYFLVSTRDQEVVDFVGIELQALDTTGTIWPARQEFLKEAGVRDIREHYGKSAYGMNWKMTAKTTLIQLHHKIQTFESIGKHLVLTAQSELMTYLRSNFVFDHVREARKGDSMHFHSYDFRHIDGTHSIQLASRDSTDASGISRCLGLKADPHVEVERVVEQIEGKISNRTRFLI